MRPTLIAPTPRLHQSWLAAWTEWGPHAQIPGSGLRLWGDFDVRSLDAFETWVQRLRAQANPHTCPLESGLVPDTFWWIVDGDRYIGSIDLRHRLNDYLAEVGGHIGFGIRPSARRRGYASWALAAVLPHAREMGLTQLLITCDAENLGSARAVERNGGVLETVVETREGMKRRYWVDL